MDIEGSDSLRLAAVDVGSNSIHMAIAQIDADGGVTTIWRMKEMVGLGRISFPSKRLTAEAMRRAFEVLARFQRIARQRNCEKLIAIATSAVREANNGGQFVKRVRGELGLFLKVVSGREEARLIYLAVRHALPLDHRPHLIVDIGGGSVEMIVGDQTQTLMLESRKLGAARLTAQYIKSDPISDDDQKKLRRLFERELGPVVTAIQKHQPVRLIGTSGTLESIAAMCGGVESTTIERGQFGKLFKQLLASDSAARDKIAGLDAARKDQILAGMFVVDELFARLNFDRIDLCHAALREGILLDYLSRHLPDLAIRREVPDPRRRSVLDLARRCEWHQRHGQQVAKLAMRLFDALQPVHDLSSRDRELIEYAALLHDIGRHIAQSGHHKHSAYLIEHGDLKDFDEDEVRLIALMARYHRKRLPDKTHAPFRELSAQQRHLVTVGTAIIRLADGMDATHGAVISDVNCHLNNGHIRIDLQTTGDAQFELWSTRRRIEAAAPLLKKSIEVHLQEQ